VHGRIKRGTVAGIAFREKIVKLSQKPSIAYYISAHGYGHGVRSCDVIGALNRLYPKLTVHIVSQLPVSFLASRIGSATQNPIRPESFDVGMVQLDSIRVDVDATLTKIQQLYERREQIVSQESAFLRENDIRLIVSDIAALPIEAAALLGIPGIAVGNFSWDWIYSAFQSKDVRWKSMVDQFREQYAKTDLLLRLPFSDAMESFPRIEDIPLTASPGINRRELVARITSCDPDKKWILLSFTTLEWRDHALDRVEQFSDYEFFTVLPLRWKRNNIHALDLGQVSFSDTVASVDAIISKPVFGILSDCVVNQKPIIYAERSDFLEYPILEAAIQKYLRHVHIPADDLYSGNLRSSLDRIWNCPQPEEKLAFGGDNIAANRIAQLQGMSP
jgi:hypothetical protein